MPRTWGPREGLAVDIAAIYVRLHASASVACKSNGGRRSDAIGKKSDSKARAACRVVSTARAWVRDEREDTDDEADRFIGSPKIVPHVRAEPGQHRPDPQKTEKSGSNHRPELGREFS